MSNNSSTPNTSGSGSSGRQVPTIQPSQATQLVQALKKEIELARAAGTDRAKAKQHSDKAENIKAILLNYQAQQKSRQQAMSQPNSAVGSPISIPDSKITSPSVASPVPSAAPSAAPSPAVHSPAPRNVSPDKSGSGTPKPATITIEKLNQVKASSESLAHSIEALEVSKARETNQEKINSIEVELNKLRPKLAQFQKVFHYLKSELIQQGKQAALPPADKGEPQSLLKTGTPNYSQPFNSNLSSLAKQAVPRPKPFESASDYPNKINRMGTTLPLSGSKLPTHTPVPNVMKYTPTSGMKSSYISRPGFIGSGTNAYGMSTPNFSKLQPYDQGNYTPLNIPDNGGRVLTKRKLAEMANVIGVDEGDSKTTMDHDVEEVVLDLADEFVASVTAFACRLAKHRKVDKVDLRDVQLHLERNWNIRVPGSATDDVRAARRWQPSADYLLKLAEVEASKEPSQNN
jgi:Transcription initiation factor TFIID, subunit TAF12 (also component of histone acetyltransferase SAGA)